MFKTSSVSRQGNLAINFDTQHRANIVITGTALRHLLNEYIFPCH